MKSPVPGVSAKGNVIDSFIVDRLRRERLEPSSQADRDTLLRRLSFDLTGLPPSLEEIDAFLKDLAPDAYEKQVERLLASPHYGERMATFWLDAARSRGYQWLPARHPTDRLAVA